ncbi:MAG: cell division protein ZapE [Pseudomonadota bacterium]
MNLIEAYEKVITQRGLTKDNNQLEAVKALNDLGLKLTEFESKHPVYRWIKNVTKRNVPIKGVYLWGGVGRGKTFIVDLFFEKLPIENKQRLHFHRFMHWVHEELKGLQGASDPLTLIAEKFAKKATVICFDEFFVSDITDAMILGELLKALFEQGVVLVATSNIHPKDLYKNGLQRERFLPVIDVIQSRCDIHNLDTDTDYRLRQLENANLYYENCDRETLQALKQHFYCLSPSEKPEPLTIEIEGRDIIAEMRCDDLVWFQFKELCEGPRSATDYIEIAKTFHTVFLTHLDKLNDDKNDAMRRFISLVDEFYDRKVKLVIAANCSIDDIYMGKGLGFEFERTKSRLIEMQSKEYLSLQHIA